MTDETVARINDMKQKSFDFENRIASSLIEFKQFSSESGKNSNLNTQQIFARQLRAMKGLGIENCAAITRVFKTPFLLRECYARCTEEKDRQALNLLNAGKLELMKNKSLFREQLVQSRDQADPKGATAQDAELPKTIEDVDRVDLGNVVTAAQSKLLPKLLRKFEQDTAMKVRKINKNQCKNLYALFT